MKCFSAVAIAAGLSLWPLALAAQQHPTYQDLWAQATHDPDCTAADYPDFTLVSCKSSLTLWYFTKPNHPAHPGVIKRTLTQQPDGSWTAQEHGSSFASDAAQPAFQAWLAQIADLDRQMREDIEKQHAAPQNGN